MANDIKMWLAEVGFIQYTDTFIENAVDYDILPQLTDSDLKELGIAKLGDRKRLLLAIK